MATFETMLAIIMGDILLTIIVFQGQVIRHKCQGIRKELRKRYRSHLNSNIR
jgi:hypothetical protein